MKPFERIPMSQIRSAKQRIKNSVVRTPLVRFNNYEIQAEIFLKLENLQPVGSFKLRGASNAMALMEDGELAQGVWTVSAGNMAQGLAWCARQRQISCTVIVPEHAPEAKLSNIKRLGANYVKVPFPEFEEAFVTRSHRAGKGKLIHPFADPAVMAGNATIGLEILEDMPDVDTIVVAYAGGGLSCGIASAIKTLKPEVRIYAAEVESGAPLAPSLAVGHPVIVDYTPSFVDGIGGSVVFDAMFPLAQSLLDGSLVVPVDEIASATKLLAERNNIIAEGAGATSVAAAISGRAGNGKIACVVSGGNIDLVKLAAILQGKVP